LVGVLGRLIGMLSGLLEPLGTLGPEADSGGLAIDWVSSCGAGFCVVCPDGCACPGFAVCANVAVALAPAIASATPAVSTAHLLRSMVVLPRDAAGRFGWSPV